MTSDTDRPRQRTVAELLAEHGDTGAASRRRRRRASEDDAGAASQDDAGGRSVVALRTVSPVPVPDATDHPYFDDHDERGAAYRAVSRPAPRSDHDPLREYPSWQEPEVPALRSARPAAPAVFRESPTDVLPRVVDARAGLGAGSGMGAAAEVTGPISLVGPGRVAPQARTASADGGPPTQFSAAVAEGDEQDRTVEGEWDDGWAGDEWDGAEDLAGDTGNDTRGADEQDLDGADDWDADEHDVDEYLDDDAEGDAGAKHGAGRRSPRPDREPTWPAVIAQWSAGAVGGAVLWVAFRYLWNSFPVVAAAAALVVVVGLVVIVRALLRNTDMRTMVFAVLVGLLLTASPAIVVLIGR